MADNKNLNPNGTDAQNNDSLDWDSIQSDLKQLEEQRKNGKNKKSSGGSSSGASSQSGESALSKVPLPVAIGLLVVAVIALIIFAVTQSNQNAGPSMVTPPGMGSQMSPSLMSPKSPGKPGESSSGFSSKGQTGSQGTQTMRPGISRPGSNASSGASESGTWTGAGTMSEQDKRRIELQRRNQVQATRVQTRRNTTFNTRSNQVRPKGNRANEGFGTDPDQTVNDY